MEKIKKTVKIAMITGDTTQCTYRDPKTGKLIECDEECNCYLLVPDTGATYTFKILLKSEVKELGFFDAAKLEDIIT